MREIRLKTPQRSLEVRISPARHPKTGLPFGGVMTVVDTTARDRTEVRLKEKISNLELLQELSGLARSNQPEDVIFSLMLEKSVIK